MKSAKGFNTAVAVALALAVALTVCLMAFPQFFGSESLAVEQAYEEKVFGTGGVLSIEITAAESDWETMLANATAEEYIACDVTVDGYTVRTAGIRCKGNSSLSTVFSSDSDRYSFKLEFDHYDSSGTLYGLDKLALNSCYADATYMKEYLSYEMFRSLGVAAPLSAFAFITVNGEPWGLYLAVECIEEGFALRNYGGETVNLYKPESEDIGRGGNFGGRGELDFAGLAEMSGGEAGELPEGMQIPEGMELPEGVQIPEGMELPEGAQIPEGMEPPGGMAAEEGQAQSGGAAEDGAAQPPAMPGNATQGNAGTRPERGERPDNQGNMPENGGSPVGMGGSGGGNDLVYTDDSLSSYANIFDSQVMGRTTDAARRRVVEALKNLSEGNLEEAMDVDLVARYFAVNTVLVNLDHYTGSFKHNYYLLEQDGLLSMLPWDYNLAFGGFGPNDGESAVNFPIDTPVSGATLAERPMIGQIIADAEGRALYHGYIEEIVAAWFESGLLQETIDSVAAMIAPYVAQDATAFYAYDEFTAGVEALKTFVTLRGESLRGQLDGTIPATEEGQAADRDALIPAGGLNMNDMGAQGGGGGGDRGQGDFGGRGQRGAGGVTPGA